MQIDYEQVITRKHAKMSSTGLLVISNLKNITSTLSAVRKYVNRVLYVHLNVGDTKPPVYSSLITKIYKDVLVISSNLDIRVLVTPLKSQNVTKLSRDIDVLLFDQKSAKNSEDIKRKYQIDSKLIFLDDNHSEPVTDIDLCENPEECKTYDNVVLGGTFDRIHLGHKLLLTEAVMRARKRLVVGVTDANMLKSKVLPELILPVQQRIRDVCDFLNDIDSTLLYQVVPIQDIYGPTKSDPEMDLIVVSPETVRGGQKINEIRALNGLKELQIHCIHLIEFDSGDKHKEFKISSSNKRMDLLGTRIKLPETRPNLERSPYIIGLVGGIASGKSHMAKRFAELGAKVIDCDKLAHELYEPGTECYKNIVDNFGKEIVGDDGKINRKILGGIVFGNPDKLKQLNQFVWPFLLTEAKERIRVAYEKEKFKVAMLDAAVLLQAGWQEECHEIWSMIIPPAEAVKRIMERNKLSEEQAKQRLNTQLDNESIVKQSNVVLCSLWSYDFSQHQAQKAWDMLMKDLEKDGIMSHEKTSTAMSPSDLNSKI